MRRFYLYRIFAIILLISLIVILRQYHNSYFNAEALTKSFEESLNTIENDAKSTLLDQKHFLNLLTSIEKRKKLSNDLIDELDKLSQKPYAIYFYKGNQLVYWSQPGLVIDPNYLNLTSFPSVLSDHRNDFLIKQYVIKGQNEDYIAFAKIPILDKKNNELNVSVTPLTKKNKFERIATETSIHSIEGEAICEIEVVGTSYPRNSQYALLFMGLFIFILLLNILVNTISYYKNKLGSFNTMVLQIGCIVLLRICSLFIPYHNYFADLPIVQSLFEGYSLSYALIDLLIDTSMILWISSKICNLVASKYIKEQEKKYINQAVSIGHYMILILMIGLLSSVMRSIMIFSNLNLDLENISYFDYKHFICIISFGLMTLSILILVHELIKQNIRLIPNLYTRLIHLIVAGILSLIFLDLIPIGASLFGFFLAVFISSILLDLFIEKGSRSIIWVITWLIAIAGFSSILMYKYQQDNDFLRRVETLHTVEEMINEEPTNINQRLVEWLPRISPKYSLGIYKGDQVIFNNYNYEYPLVLGESLRPPSPRPTERQIGNRNEVSIQTDQGMWLFAGKDIEGPIGVISLFSYIFTIYSILLFIIAAINSSHVFLPVNFNISFSSRPTLKNKIQLAIVFIILLTFIIIGLVTVFYMRSTAQLDSNRRYEDKLQTLATSINETIRTNTTNDEIAQAAKVAYANSSRAKIYDHEGNIIFRPSEYNDFENPPPVKMSFKAKMVLDYSNSDYTIERENSESEISSAGFIGVKKESELSKGYVEFPNSNLVNAQENAGTHIFSTLLNAYVFLFLIAVALAIAIANSITKPLSQLGEKMKRTRLGMKNEPISWNNEDEIGELINDYNGMIIKLDDSAKILAQSERDLAWREMAKQVAHEIKNPLTPMKLSIQYLQNAVKQNKENLTEMAGRVSYTLIEQIDNLANIATEFSNFATMPSSSHEKVVLNEIVASIHDLFRKRDDMDIQLYVPINEILVFADKNQLLRVLTNLMKNAMQAIPETRRGKISIVLSETENIGIIEVKDNGVGIENDKREQVFYPNFTTKSSGTGLGLAMSSNIIDAFNGKLYFETELDKGSSFFIELPLMRKEQPVQK